MNEVSRSGGRLRGFIENWKRVTSDTRVLEWIDGYEIPFVRSVTQNAVPKKPAWSVEEKTKIKEHIEKLVAKGAISKALPQKDQFLSNIFLIPKPDGSSRLIMNLKKLNDFIETDHFKLEDYKVACKLVSRDCFMGKLDLKDAYYLISIQTEFRKYLIFSFEDTLYEFNCLPFGLSTAPYVFTKLMKPVISHLRELGFLSVIYLDDLLLFGNTYSNCLKNINTSVELLESLGFIINDEKSCKIPSQTCKFLGFVLNSKKMTIELPIEKRHKISNRVKEFKKFKKCKIKDLAQLIGSLVSCCPAVKYSWAHIKILEREKYLALCQIIKIIMKRLCN